MNDSKTEGSISQPAAPTDSANPSPPPEAHAAPVEASGATEASAPKTGSEPAPTQSGDSSPSKSGAAPPSGKSRKTPLPKYSLKRQEQAFKRRKEEVRNIADSIIQGELADVEAAFLKAAEAGTFVSSASAKLEDAKTTWDEKSPPLYAALSRVGALLNLSTAGKELYKACKATTKMGWAENITQRLPPGDLGLPADLTANLRTQVAKAKPYAQAYDDALQAQRAAAARFEAARTQLDGNLAALYGSYIRYEGARKAGKVNAGATAEPHPTNGTATKHASPAKNGVKNGIHRAV
ncbi:MAG: hypothetical protein JST54_28130 [Deltaproteobacteria bacterium]|nr:hypothetical protein [Deltaproteobacteria bacterium]